SIPSAIAGAFRESDVATPVCSESFRLQIAFPVSASILNRFPFQSGTYSALYSTVGVALISPSVRNVHFTARFPAFRGERRRSRLELWVLCRFPPQNLQVSASSRT